MKTTRRCGWQKIQTVLCLLCLILLFVIAGCTPAKTGESLLTETEKQANLDSFEVVWKTIRDNYYDPTLGGLDWQRVHDELLVHMKKAKTMPAARLVLTDMISRLNRSLFTIIPGTVYRDMRHRENLKKKRPDLSRSSQPNYLRTGTNGIDLRVIGDQGVVTAVEKYSPADKAGIRPGWLILKVNAADIPPLIKGIASQYENKSWKNMMVTFTIKEMLLGTIGQQQVLLLENGYGQRVEKKIHLAKGKGENARLGDFNLGYVWCEKKFVEGNIGYIAFNSFLDIRRIMPIFNDAIKEFMNTNGIIIDLRGNPGGFRQMAKGIAGWFIEKKGQSLGTLIVRNNQFQFAILPRPEVYRGRLAILIDNCSASTAECFAAGMRDLGRARLFGENSAGVALLSLIIKLPNGDGFQYAVANYRSIGGHMLEGYGVMLNEQIPLTREDLLEGKDPVMEAAVQWIIENIKYNPNE